MVPPPTHGLAQRVPKWLDFLLHSHLLVPRESGSHWQSCPSILKSHRLPQTPSSHTSEPGFPRGQQGESLPLPETPLTLGLCRPPVIYLALINSSRSPPRG